MTLERQCDYDLDDNILSSPFNTSQVENNLSDFPNKNKTLITSDLKQLKEKLVNSGIIKNVNYSSEKSEKAKNSKSTYRESSNNSNNYKYCLNNICLNQLK